jgi:predicted DNA-binding transcriptional regulator AlpA
MTMTTTTTTTTPRWEEYLRRCDPVFDTTLRWNDIIRITGLQKSQIKLKISKGEFPAPFLISDTGRSLGWHASEVSAWCAAREALREATRGQARGVMPSQKSLKNLKRSTPTRTKKAARR